MILQDSYAIRVAVAIALTSAAVDAQQPDDSARQHRRLGEHITTLPVGTQLRVNAGCITCIQSRGALVRATADTLWLGSASNAKAIPAREIVSLDSLASGRWAGASRGMVLGFLAGGVLGVVIGAASPDQPNSGIPSRGAGAIVGFAFFGAAGAVVGAVTGFVTRGERWHPLPPPRPPR